MDTDSSLQLETASKIFNEKVWNVNTKMNKYLNSMSNLFLADVKGNSKVKNIEDLFTEQAFFTYTKVLQEMSNSNLKNNKFPGDVKFSLLQTYRNKKKMLFNLSKFYNNNFTGNRDFIHIPGLQEVMSNCKFPILIATRKSETGKEEIIGTTTIKFERNLKKNENPYFPTKNEYVISINGILSKLYLNNPCGSRIRGIGKELFKIAIMGAYQISRQREIRLMCKVDCRNYRSMNAISDAVNELKQEGINAQVYINGYYELRGLNKKLMEAPTFTVEVSFDGKCKLKNNDIDFSFINCEPDRLYEDVKLAVETKTVDRVVYTNRYNDRKIVYHEIEPIDLITMGLESGNSADGNSRTTVAVNLFA